MNRLQRVVAQSLGQATIQTPQAVVIPGGGLTTPTSVSVVPSCPSGYSTSRPRSLTIPTPGCSTDTVKASDGSTDCYKETCGQPPRRDVFYTPPTTPPRRDVFYNPPTPPTRQPRLRGEPPPQQLPPEWRGYPPPSYGVPPLPYYEGGYVLQPQPAPCCPGPCRLIPWNWWHRGGPRIY